jgi:hypothetical protein
MVILMKNLLLFVSALVSVFVITGRVVHYLIGASDLGLILLVSHGIHYLINGLNEAASPEWFSASPSLMVGAVAVLLGAGGLWFGIYHSRKT